MCDFKSLTRAVLLVLLFFACSKEQTIVPQFSVDITADSFPPTGGIKTITLSSDLSWSTLSSHDWLTVSPESGTGNATLTLTATENNTPSTRKGSVTLSPETGDAIRITVSQSSNLIFAIDARELILDASPQDTVVVVTSNSPWQASSNVEWLSVTPMSGPGDGVLTLTATLNDTAHKRMSVVTLSSEAGEVIEIPVTQNGILFATDLSEISFGENPGEHSITLTTDIPWEVSFEADWFSVDPVSGNGQKEEKVTVTVHRNTTQEERTAIITIMPEYGSSIEITVIQKGASYVGDIVRYVSYEASGNSSGDSAANAADFLSPSFWEQVNSDLESKSVEVIFLPGDYTRAYISAGSGGNGLAFNRMGNENNRLILTGGEGVLFKVPEGYAKRNTLIHFHGSQNITFRDFSFSGNGEINYVLAIRTPSGYPPSRNILIENCSWTDMRGVVYGATGCHFEGTTGVTYKNCIFQRIGFNTGSHMMYHAYGPTHVYVYDSFFEDCAGEYVRFRDRTDYGIVKNCTFNRNSGWIGAAFVSIPNYNNNNPGNEYFGTNYAFIDNLFQDSRYGIQFRHTGFSPSDYHYLLTAEEGAILESGTKAQKIKLLKDNFGLDVNKIRIVNNSYPGIYDKRVSINSGVMYGAESLGWTGTADITNIFDANLPPFDWEK